MEGESGVVIPTFPSETVSLSAKDAFVFELSPAPRDFSF